MTMLVTADAVRRAAASIAGHVLHTPSVDSPGLAAVLGRPVALKLEILQMSGCFKPRGIVNKVLSLTEAERASGLLTVTGGNHGIAIGTPCRCLACQCQAGYEQRK